jgi:hypothetical protein
VDLDTAAGAGNSLCSSYGCMFLQQLHAMMLVGTNQLVCCTRPPVCCCATLDGHCAVVAVCCCRLAPLSEGRIDANGTLMCSYHGAQLEEQQRRQRH